MQGGCTPFPFPLSPEPQSSVSSSSLNRAVALHSFLFLLVLHGHNFSILSSSFIQEGEYPTLLKPSFFTKSSASHHHQSLNTHSPLPPKPKTQHYIICSFITKARVLHPFSLLQQAVASTLSSCITKGTTFQPVFFLPPCHSTPFFQTLPP